MHGASDRLRPLRHQRQHSPSSTRRSDAPGTGVAANAFFEAGNLDHTGPPGECLRRHGGAARVCPPTPVELAINENVDGGRDAEHREDRERPLDDLPRGDVSSQTLMMERTEEAFTVMTQTLM